MKKNYLFTGFSLILLIILIPQILVQTSCANIIPPEGGEKDTIPPRLVKASPPEYSTDFSDGRITLTFNEYVDVDNYLQNLVVSPFPSNMPTLTRKLNTVTIKLRDTLERNTTYSLDFGKSIKDVNEGNIMKDFKYIFSTGSFIDSLMFAGKVVLAETGETDSTLTVMLHKTGRDSALINEKPRYITKLDSKGNFIFRNLSPGTFYVYALKDESGSYRYLSKKQVFAFADSAVTITANTKPVLLYAYSAEQEKETPAAPAAPTTTRTGRRSGSVDKRLKFQTNLNNGTQDLLERFAFIFSVPLKNFDSSKIHFSTDTLFTPVTGYHWEADSALKHIELVYPWKENTVYNLIMEKEFATDTLNQQLLKADTLSFITTKASDYGKLSLRFRNIDLSKNPVILFVENNTVAHSFPLTSEVLTREMFPPGEYNIRILYDENKNGKWDPGEFFGKRKQPEMVIPLERKLNIRPRYSNVFEISL